VRDTVRHYCALYERGADPQALVELVGLRGRADATWRKLSGGERQRLSLALALAARPDVAFLDEPTSGVDVTGRDTIRDVVRDLAREGCAVVLATHELDEAERGRRPRADLRARPLWSRTGHSARSAVGTIRIRFRRRTRARRRLARRRARVRSRVSAATSTWSTITRTAS
jgi:ABC-type nitrate/sulfonate/bicarbonate transport system ATPase subunit